MSNKRINKKQCKRQIENNAYLHKTGGIMVSGSINYPRRRQLEKTFKGQHPNARVGYVIEQASEHPKHDDSGFNLGFVNMAFAIGGE